MGNTFLNEKVWDVENCGGCPFSYWDNGLPKFIDHCRALDIGNRVSAPISRKTVRDDCPLKDGTWTVKL